MKPKTPAAVLLLMLLTSAAASGEFVSSAAANPDGTYPQLSMPIEHINYTITTINGSLWAKIDGSYPIQLLNQADCSALPMVYPMPPNSTNIYISLDGTELGWFNYTQIYPGQLHKTAIGDWWMIYSVLENPSDAFMLKIHYEHPLERVNGSFLFLYDLNIRDYLSAQSPQSTAYFTIQFDTNITQVQAYTAPPDSTPNQWKPKTYTTSNEDIPSIVSVEMHSKYNADLPGDLVIVFSSDPQNISNKEELPPWIIPVAINVVFIAILLYVKRKAVASAFSSRKTPTN
jgi:hypothetical protein